LLQRFHTLLFTAQVDPCWEEGRSSPALSVDEQSAVAFCEGLWRTLGEAYGLGLYRRRPVRLIREWGPLRRVRSPDPILPLIGSGFQDVVNRDLGRGKRLSLLELPTARGTGRSSYVVAIQVNSAALERAARLLRSMASGTEGTGTPEHNGHLGDAIDRMIEAATEGIGVPITEMSRSQKQEVVKYLDDRGAFLIKKAVEQVGVRLGVTRFTIYNYLEETNRADGAGGKGAE
jgi:DNA binding protein with HTH domain